MKSIWSHMYPNNRNEFISFEEKNNGSVQQPIQHSQMDPLLMQNLMHWIKKYSFHFFGFLFNACGKGRYLEAGSSALKMGEKWSDGESLKRRVGGNHHWWYRTLSFNMRMEITNCDRWNHLNGIKVEPFVFVGHRIKEIKREKKIRNVFAFIFLLKRKYSIRQFIVVTLGGIIDAFVSANDHVCQESIMSKIWKQTWQICQKDVNKYF